MIKKRNVLAAAALGLLVVAPVAGMAQQQDLACSANAVQTYCIVKDEVMMLGLDEAMVKKLDMASDEQLRELETIVMNEDTPMQVKQERVTAILETIQ